MEQRGDEERFSRISVRSLDLLVVAAQPVIRHLSRFHPCHISTALIPARQGVFTERYHSVPVSYPSGFGITITIGCFLYFPFCPLTACLFSFCTFLLSYHSF